MERLGLMVRLLSVGGIGKKKRCGGKSANELFSSVKTAMVVRRGSGSLIA